MNIVKTLIEKQTIKLLNDLEKLADKITDRAIDASESLSPVKIAKAGELPPNEIREYSRIQSRLSVLSMLSDSLVKV